MGKISVMRPRPADIHPLLVLHASHRVDSLMLCLKCLERFTDFARFKRIYVLHDAAAEEHRVVLSRFAARTGNVVVRECPAGGPVPGCNAVLNEIFAEHRRDVVVRVDADVFVTPRWLDHLVEGYRQHAHLDDVVLVSPLIPVSAAGRRVLGRFLRVAYPSERHMYAGPPVEQDWVYHRWMWEKVVREGLAAAWLDESGPPYHYLDEVAPHCAIYDRRLIERVYPLPVAPVQGLPVTDVETMVRAMQSGSLRTAVLLRSVAHHYSFPECEDYLRGHVSLEAVWRYTESLRVDPVAQDAPRPAIRRPALRLLAAGGLHRVMRA
ncbi:glycosyltransferase [Desulfovibrio sulfodismutans]|uniref:Glycosyltransferase n=1 Tax=Desulfolutivibrio sulfodismutans TaxID=63561 RepID=A0A7K3NKX7_9BACT|nr:glycosyltransferase [Desulfolutivibrio sulfodismutans]NDY56856.1 glycosyltransferase [Desulfolutivibrio sulfodismutans]QLA13879.1 glycosyltransferase [Desulfolutivibrio sulfodismutans DSM 3696]